MYFVLNRFNFAGFASYHTRKSFVGETFAPSAVGKADKT